MKKSLFCILLCSVAFSLKAQVFESLHSDNYLKVIEDTSKSRFIHPFFFSDKDTNVLHLLSKKYASIDSTSDFFVDDDLNIIEGNTFDKNIIHASYYFSNKIYNCRGSAGMIYSQYYFTSFFLSSFDSVGNELRVDTIMRETDDTIKWSAIDHKVLLLEDKNFLLVVIGLQDYNNPDALVPENLKIIKFDTLGNVLKTKIYYSPIRNYDICEMPNNIMCFLGGALAPSQMNEKSKIYYLNKETLEPEDSIMGYHPSNMTKINDSLFAFHYYFAQQLEGYPEDTIASICLMNINTKRHINTDFRYYMDYSNNIFMMFESDPMVKVIDFRTTDSIYACYIIRDGFYSYCAIEICNFNINGDTNFIYRINLKTEGYKSIIRVKATQDGGVLIIARSLDTGFAGKNNIWLVKYHPKGEIGLRNIETGEKETIHVYPNPAKDFINVDIEATNFMQSEIELFDMQGKLVKKAKLNAKQGNRIDVSNLNSGAYTYNVMLNGKTISGKVIIGK